LRRVWWSVALACAAIGAAALVAGCGGGSSSSSSSSSTTASTSSSTTSTSADAAAVSKLCTDLHALQVSINTLLRVKPTPQNQPKIQADLAAVDANYAQVQSSAKSVPAAKTTALESAYTSFQNDIMAFRTSGYKQSAYQKAATSGKKLGSEAGAVASAQSCPS
jgi:hypothetical protein